MVYRVHNIIEGQPTFDVPLQLILDELKPGGALKVLSPQEYRTLQQTRWYKGVCIKGLSAWSGESEDWWDAEVKSTCGKGLVIFSHTRWNREEKREEDVYTIKGMGVRAMSKFIENILLVSAEKWITAEGQMVIHPPDPEMKG